MFATFVLAAALQTGPAFVQLPNGGFVPCDHPLAIAAGLGCGQATPTAPTPAPVPPAPDPTAPVCDPRPNPYTEGERAARCAAWEIERLPPPVLPVYVVGQTYRDPYDDFRIVVLAVSRSLEGVPVVTAQYIRGPVGHVVSFRVTEGLAWDRVQ